jgi:hypothetical protein
MRHDNRAGAKAADDALGYVPSWNAPGARHAIVLAVDDEEILVVVVDVPDHARPDDRHRAGDAFSGAHELAAHQPLRPQSLLV